MRRRIRSKVCPVPLCRHRQSFTMPLYYAGIPAIERQCIFLLKRTQLVCRRKIKSPTWPKHSCEFSYAHLPIWHVLEKFYREADIHRIVWPRQLCSRSQNEFDLVIPFGG